MAMPGISQHAPDLFSGVTDPLSGTPGERRSSGRHPRNEDLPCPCQGGFRMSFILLNSLSEGYQSKRECRICCPDAQKSDFSKKSDFFPWESENRRPAGSVNLFRMSGNCGGGGGGPLCIPGGEIGENGVPSQRVHGAC